MELPGEWIIEGVARAVGAWLEADPQRGAAIVSRVAELQGELLTPEEAARLLGVSPKTLRVKWRAYGLDKSTAMGPGNPRFFRSQVLAALRREGKLLHGRTVSAAGDSVAAPLAPRVPAGRSRRHAPTLHRPPATPLAAA